MWPFNKKKVKQNIFLEDDELAQIKQQIYAERKKKKAALQEKFADNIKAFQEKVDNANSDRKTSYQVEVTKLEQIAMQFGFTIKASESSINIVSGGSRGQAIVFNKTNANVSIPPALLMNEEKMAEEYEKLRDKPKGHHSIRYLQYNFETEKLSEVTKEGDSYYKYPYDRGGASKTEKNVTSLIIAKATETYYEAPKDDHLWVTAYIKDNISGEDFAFKLPKHIIYDFNAKLWAAISR